MDCLIDKSLECHTNSRSRSYKRYRNYTPKVDPTKNKRPRIACLLCWFCFFLAIVIFEFVSFDVVFSLVVLFIYVYCA